MRWSSEWFDLSQEGGDPGRRRPVYARTRSGQGRPFGDGWAQATVGIDSAGPAPPRGSGLDAAVFGEAGHAVRRSLGAGSVACTQGSEAPCQDCVLAPADRTGTGRSGRGYARRSCKSGWATLRSASPWTPIPTSPPASRKRRRRVSTKRWRCLLTRRTPKGLQVVCRTPLWGVPARVKTGVAGRVQVEMAEGVGFEPTVGKYPTTVFKTVALNHSAIPPRRGVHSLADRRFRGPEMTSPLPSEEARRC